MTWGKKLKRNFNIDIETCEVCQGHVKIIACIEDPVVIDKILTHLKKRKSR
jgi:REP element-mobilizing transposase RayT